MSEIETFRNEVSNRLDVLTSTVEKLVNAMHDFVRVESEQQHQGKEVQRGLDWLNDHEKRIRAVELQQSATKTTIGMSAHAVWVFVTLGLNITTGIVVFAITGGG